VSNVQEGHLTTGPDGREYLVTRSGDKVHKPNCFIITTRWPDLDWVRVDKPVTCGFCGPKR
jgi:hypothetical protein